MSWFEIVGAGADPTLLRGLPAAPVIVLGLEGETLPAGSAELLTAARLVVGGRAQLERLMPVPAALAITADSGPPPLPALTPDGVPQVALQGDLSGALAALAACEGVAVVLASGDPGFFGILRRLREALGPDRLVVLPARSSVALAFARLGLPWDDAIVVSAHSREPHAALAVARRHPKVAIFTGPGAASADRLAAGLLGSDRRLVVLSHLGGPSEHRHAGSPEELAQRSYADPNLLISLAPEVPSARVSAWPPRTPPGWALPDDAFAHRAGMLTKAEVRALALARLGPGVGDLVWDVGCGSGAVGVECARLGAALIAIDHDPGAIALTRENAAAHGVPVQTVLGRAPDALSGLPDPDVAFVGGGGRDLEAIVGQTARRVRRAIVVTLATVERVGPILDVLTAVGLQAEGTQLAASRVQPLGDGHRLAAGNPVFVLSGTR